VDQSLNILIIELTFLCFHFRSQSHRCSFHTSKGQQAQPPDDDLAKPVQYSNTEANDWKAYDTFLAEENARPKYQFLILTASWVVFLVYFLILREENDIDEHLSTSLYDHLPGLEAQQLELAIGEKEERGEDTTALVARLKAVQSADSGQSSE